MRVLALNGSPNKNGNSAHLLESFVSCAGNKGAEVARYDLNNMNIKPCQGCNACKNDMTGFCVMKDDMARLYEELRKSDLLVVSTPVYFGETSAQVKVFIDRLFALYKPSFEMKITFPKKAAVLFAHDAGMDSEFFTKLIQPYHEHFIEVLRLLNVEDPRIFSVSTGEKPVAENPDALADVEKLAAEMVSH
jgi:multimeric flavodoxin WrbA